MPFRLNQINFGSLLSYCPRGTSPAIQSAKDLTLALKQDSPIEDPPVLPSEWIARTIEENRSTLPFVSLFQSDTVLVPIPRSSLLGKDYLWVPQRIANALVRRGFGSRAIPCLIRTRAVLKSAYVPASQRPTPTQHYDSIAIQGDLSAPNDIVLVDDIVTRGSTIMGAANRLLDAFPSARIGAFAAIRTISSPLSFRQLYSPVFGTINYHEETDESFRSP
jgi:hypothetical protein